MATLDNGLKLRNLLKESGLAQVETLTRFNEGQAKKMALRTFETYLAIPGSKTRVSCPDGVLERMEKILRVSSNSVRK